MAITSCRTSYIKPKCLLKPKNWIKHVLVSCGRKMGLEILPNLQCKRHLHFFGNKKISSNLVYKQLNAISIDTERPQIFHFKVIGLTYIAFPVCGAMLEIRIACWHEKLASLHVIQIHSYVYYTIRVECSRGGMS